MVDLPPHDSTAPRFEQGQEAEGKVPALIVWGLYALTIPSGSLLVLVGIIVAYAARGSATGLPRQHLDAQIGLFWSAFWWLIACWVGLAVSAIAAFLLIGIPFLLLFAFLLLLLCIWFTVKSVLGLLALLGGRAP